MATRSTLSCLAPLLLTFACNAGGAGGGSQGDSTQASADGTGDTEPPTSGPISTQDDTGATSEGDTESSTHDGGSESDTGTDTDAPIVCTEVGFAASATSWTLAGIPATNQSNDPMMNTARDLECDAGGYARIATLDLDGDALPDMVRTDECVSGGAGLSRWDVYLNTGSGFAKDSTAWSLPPIPATNQSNDPMMNLFRDLACDAGGYSRIATVDLDGDALPDLVQTDDCATAGAGLVRWDVYRNLGDGFADEPIAWSLPPIPATNQSNDPMMNLSRDLECDAGGYSRIATVDLDGDALPDLVQTDDCANGGLGATTWDVYLNTGSGFADDPVAWSLPPIAPTNQYNDPMMNLYRDLECDAGGYSRIATVDLDGDARPDLVQTDDCAAGGLGATTWDVYLNTGNGFSADPIAWTLPPIPTTNQANDPMMNTARDLECDAGGYSRIATLDLDGDLRPDVLHTDDCGSGGLGLTTWEVYLNTGDGFAQVATSWALPPIPMTNAFNDPMMNLARDLECDAGGYSRITTMDLDGDALPEIVRTDDCGSGGLGLESWDVYWHPCSGG